MNAQETHAEVIAEMRGAKTEFPFVYLMCEPDTPEVIDLKTKEIRAPRKINIRRVTVKELANRLEAAHERERGNFAALREALKAIGRLCAGQMITGDSVFWRIKDITEVALAEPPRNCDRYSHDEALQVWASEKENERNGKFDEWLYEIAKEGGAK